MRQAITTRFVGPTNYNGSRIIARAAAGRKTYGWNDSLDVEANHTGAARMYAKSLDWLTPSHGAPLGWTLAGGGLPSGDGYCYVIVPIVEGPRPTAIACNRLGPYSSEERLCEAMRSLSRSATNVEPSGYGPYWLAFDLPEGEPIWRTPQ